MSTVEGKKQEKRRALLDAAYELFLERGTAKTSVEDITSRAKVGKGTFYLYFQDKGAVMQALLGRVSYQLLSDACEAVEKQTELENFPDKMVAVIDHIIEALRKDTLVLKFLEHNFIWPGLDQIEASREAEAPGREIYVYIIGEASRAMSWELYGYERETNPRLSQVDDLVIFRDVLTQSNTTHKSVPLILSSVSTEEHDQLYRRKGLPALFNEAGFETWFISNQSPQGAMIDHLAHDARHVIYIRSPRHDMQLLDEMRRIVETSPAQKMLFILHCYGSHFSYHQRYPREFARFKPDDDVAISREHAHTLRNAYDNSICYTDHFLAETIAFLRGLRQTSSALLYCADHGEDILDDDRERFLHASPTTTAYQLYVASLAWFSDAYRRNFPAKAAAAGINETAPATTHALFHTMADMASIRGRFVDPTVSLVNPGYDRKRPRRYLNDHNEAVPFRKTGLEPEDMEVFARFGIKP